MTRTGTSRQFGFARTDHDIAQCSIIDMIDIPTEHPCKVANPKP